MRPETLAIHAGYAIDSTTGSLTPPIHLSTTFERALDGSYPSGYIYNRDNNPNRAELEARLTALEGGADCLTFASGSVAMMTLIQALKSGDHVIAPVDMYYGIRIILKEFFVDWGLSVSFVDMTDLQAVMEACRPTTRLIVIETPSNPQINLTDIAKLAEIAHQHEALLVCDNTIASPIFQNPLALGADIVVHATTKYLAGHSDVLGGALITRTLNPLFEKVRRLQKIGGAVPSPFDCWLTLRGISSLPYRMAAHHANGLAVATYLATHPKIERVLHPLLPTHPQHDLARQQMRGYSGLFSILVKGDAQDALGITHRLGLFKRATSFGGSHSLIEHRASIEAADSPTPKNLLRLSVGLEHPDDLLKDLDRALG